jgi:polyisoprenyl-phosphate glycosyltransferase
MRSEDRVAGRPGRTQRVPDLSVVVPMFNEALNIDAFFARLLPVLESLAMTYEVICVDDGSVDATHDLVYERAREMPAVKLISLSRNFGKEVALTAGLHRATGAAVIPIDADLQHPPELIPKLIEKWREGYDVVYAARTSRETDTRLRRMAAHGFYWVFGQLSKVKIAKDAGDFRLLDRRVVEALNRMPERSRFMKGIFAWVGYKQIGVPYVPEKRHEGRSGWRFSKLFHFAVDGLTAFSNFPLIAWGYIGGLIAMTSLGAGTYFLIRTMLEGVDVPGYASVMVAILFFGGVQLLTLGIIGSYLGRVFEEVKGRPLYLVRDSLGFDDTVVSAAPVTRRPPPVNTGRPARLGG